MRIFFLISLIICFQGNTGKVVIIVFQNGLVILLLLKNASKN